MTHQYTLKTTVHQPGSRGGSFWVDDNGNIRYGIIPPKYSETLQQRAYQEWFHREIVAGRLPKVKKPVDARKLKEWWDTTIWAQAAREKQTKLFKANSKLALLPSKKDPRKKRWQRTSLEPKDFKKHGIQAKATDAFQYENHPKWTHEWRDPKDRLIRRYTPKFIEVKAKQKFKRVEAAIKHIPELRQSLQKDTRSRDPKKRSLALAIIAIEQTAMRVGTSQHEGRYGTHGATTLNKEHVTVKGDTVILEYVGKKSKEQKHTISDPAYARQMRKLLKQKGDKVFAYTENGKTKAITSNDVNTYLKTFGITAKDIRTFKANVVFTSVLKRLGRAKDEKHAKKNIIIALDETADHLGNTRAVAKAKYVSPIILNAYLEGKRLKSKYLRKSMITGWNPEEKEFIRMWDKLKQGMQKSRVKQHMRRTKGGRTVIVKEYENIKEKRSAQPLITPTRSRQPSAQQKPSLVDQTGESKIRNAEGILLINGDKYKGDNVRNLSKTRYKQFGKKYTEYDGKVFRLVGFDTKEIRREGKGYEPYLYVLDEKLSKQSIKEVKEEQRREEKDFWLKNEFKFNIGKALVNAVGKELDIPTHLLKRFDGDGSFYYKKMNLRISGHEPSPNNEIPDNLIHYSPSGEPSFVIGDDIIAFDPSADTKKTILKRIAESVKKQWSKDKNTANKSLTFSGHKLQGRTIFQGMKISIENRAGSYRRGKDPGNKKLQKEYAAMVNARAMFHAGHNLSENLLKQ